MFQSTFALFQQSLRTESRKLSSHLCLLLSAGCPLLILWFSERFDPFRPAPGLAFFKSIVYLNLGYILLASIGSFSKVLTEEKEADTLGLLKMTGMSPLVLLFGKSTSQLCFSLLLLCLQIPYVMLSITLGGVMLEQILACYLALACFMIMMANLGLLSSVICQTSKSAHNFTTTILFSYLYALPLLHQYLVQFNLDSSYWYLIPFWNALEFLVTNNIVSAVSNFHNLELDQTLLITQASTNLCAGAVLFVLSLLLFEKYSYPDRTKISTTKEPHNKKETKPPHNRSRVWKNAFTWQEFHFACGGFLMFYSKFALGLLALFSFPLIIYITDGYKWNITREGYGVGVALVSLTSILLELILFSSLIFKEAHSETFSAIYILPKNIRSISYYKILGRLYALIPNFSFLLIGCVINPEIVVYFSKTTQGPITLILCISEFFLYSLFVSYVSLLAKQDTTSLGIIGAFVILPSFFILTQNLSIDSGSIFYICVLYALSFPFITGALLWLIKKRLQQLAAK